MAYGVSFLMLPPSHWRALAPGTICGWRHGVSVRISLLF